MDEEDEQKDGRAGASSPTKPAHLLGSNTAIPRVRLLQATIRDPLPAPLQHLITIQCSTTKMALLAG